MDVPRNRLVPPADLRRDLLLALGCLVAALALVLRRGRPQTDETDPVMPRPASNTARPQGRSRIRRGPSGMFLAVSLVGSLIAVGCAGTDRPPSPSALGDDSITVGSFDFAESRLLAEIYSQALEREGLPVVRALSLGPREFVAPALSRGLLELVPEYAGTAAEFLSAGAAAPLLDASATHAALEKALQGRSLQALAPAPAQNANTFVVTPAVAERFDLRTLSDVVRVADQLTLGGPPECPQRPTCLQGLREVYGMDFERFIPLDAGGPISLQALLVGEVDVALLFTTDPAITEKQLVELADDRHLQPAESITPLLRTEVVARWGTRVVTALDNVSRHLTTESLRRLNAEVAAGTPPERVAANWIESEQR